jgi:hypothetical protein
MSGDWINSRRTSVEHSLSTFLRTNSTLAFRTKQPLDGYAKPQRGWEKLYVEHVTQADVGVDLDFFRGLKR